MPDPVLSAALLEADCRYFGRSMTAIGIDLGTTNSAVAVLDGGEVRVLQNELGDTLTPSVVALDRISNALLTGRPAKELFALDPQRAALMFKRGMGREQLYRIVDNEYGAVELSGILLRALREGASAALGHAVTQCVITVPAYFDEEQRYATTKAGELAGLEVLRVLNEPTAAAMAHGLHERAEDSRFLVLDLGGGTFDVCVMERFEGTLQVQSTAGESHLGGEDFTRRLAAHVLKEVGQTYEEIELKYPRAFGLLLKRSELAKRSLSDTDEAEITVPELPGRIDRSVPIRVLREEAEEVWKPLLQRLLAPCRMALRDAGMRPFDPDGVLLVGGATRMPCFRSFAREYFEQEPRSDIDPDLAVVEGAAIQAALCLRDEAVEDIVVTDVLSHSLGTDIAKRLANRIVDGYFSPVIPRNTVIPTSRTESYWTLIDRQTSMVFGIYEGESRHVSENRRIGTLTVKGIPKAPAGEQEVEARFTYDVNGILEVEARVVATGRTFNRVFSRSGMGLSDADLERAKKRIEKLKQDPRQDPKNRDLLLRAELLWQELPVDQRHELDDLVDQFESSLETRNPEEIRRAHENLLGWCERSDGGERW